MSFASRITTFPRAIDPARGQDVAQSLNGPLAALVAGVAGSSNHLARLAQIEGDWLTTLADQQPEDVLDALCMPPQGDPAFALRQAKRRVALLTGLADLGGVWPTMQVTAALSRFADMALDHGARHIIAAEIARGKLPSQDQTAGYVILAMGKMGAGELNYSSDIDLICLFDETQHAPEDFTEVRAALIRVTKKLMQMIGAQTADGYVFRTDLRLRPDPSTTPVCIAMDAAERYYESLGRTWERSAYIKARACAGDIPAGEAFLKRMRPFIWRRHLDFAAIRDVQDMMHRIRDHKGLSGPIDPTGHDVKLGRGGIREIEFFAQTRQLIAGGRDGTLRDKTTLGALESLARAGQIPAKIATALTGHYTALRDIEHRIQMLEDAQTHCVPRNPDSLERLSALCGHDTTAAFLDALGKRLAAVHAICMPQQVEEETAPKSEFETDSQTLQITAAWPNLPAFRSPRAEALFHQLAPGILSRLAGAADPHAALAHFDSFLRGLPAGVQVFSLFEARPALQDLLVEICATAPALARYLGRNASVFDAVLDREFFAELPGLTQMTTALDAVLAEATDYEQKLDATRRWQKEVRFRIGVHLLRGIAGGRTVERAYSDLAQCCIAALLPIVIRDQSRRHGAPPGAGAVVLAMGKLGSAEMTATSDLDLIMLYDAPSDAMSDGTHPLGAAQYYARLTKRLITALSAQMAEGQLYEVDMRLRPSGRQGPVATSLAGFQRYQAEEAWTWEHLALTRARPVAGPDAVQQAVERAVTDIVTIPGDAQKIRNDTADMRRRLMQAHRPGSVWQLKQGPGRLLDIDLFLQAGCLLSHASSVQIGDLTGNGWLTQQEATSIAEARTLMSTLQAVGRVALDDGFAPDRAGPSLIELVLAQTGFATIDALRDALERHFIKVSGIISDRLA
ncbi:glutamine-synthetase adenylyltransferase [Monaibacterium marinum]|nr:glutamine-synthetase adenylyltransferase [Monaibacterium marinum]